MSAMDKPSLRPRNEVDEVKKQKSVPLQVGRGLPDQIRSGAIDGMPRGL